jgi:hypothetical protein
LPDADRSGVGQAVLPDADRFGPDRAGVRQDCPTYPDGSAGVGPDGLTDRGAPDAVQPRPGAELARTGPRGTMREPGTGGPKIESCGRTRIRWRRPMHRRKLAAWLGFPAAMGAGFGLLCWAHQPARPEAERERAKWVEPRWGHGDESVLSVETGQDESGLRRDGEGKGHLRQVSLVRGAVPAVPSPPLPSRVLPGPLPGRNEGNPPDATLSPSPQAPTKSPPVPDKTLPRASPGDGDTSSDQPIGSDSSVEN